MDTRKGMEPAELTALQAKLDMAYPKRVPDGQEETSIGLTNIHIRLRLLFGEGYGITIDSRFGHGTTVTVKIPA
nr:hypothetical protein [Paenibacillus methanolicus]